MYYNQLQVNSGLIIGALVTLVFLGLIFGSACMCLAEHKGYKNYFPVGFLFGIFGLIYVAGLPVSDERAKEQAAYLAKRIAYEVNNYDDKKQS
jgi:hypothetical protein